ncbi:MAG: prepilin-type N-terminal cleavage/methylation domain-containing protein [Candidatus Poribacteria bacterium]|nr:prepilin-type N-terminal cleavage/methylation domain-containing protein [Candidatus Poribacteria bacterium]
MTNRLLFAREEGFTLAEILITIAIMAAILPALLKVFSDTNATIGKTDHRITALYLLKSKMAELEAAGYPETGQDSDVFGGNSIFEWQTAVTDVESEEIIGLRKIELTVSWEHVGRMQSISMFSYMASREIQQQEN